MQELAEKEEITLKVECEGKEFKLTKEMISFESQEKTIQEEKFIPSVIEPAFGIGRVIYCIFEHCFKVREDDQNRTYFAFPPLIAPVKTSILPLINNAELNQVVQQISKHIFRC